MRSEGQKRLDERLRQAEAEIEEAERKHPHVSFAFDNFLNWVAFAVLAMWLAARYCG